MIIDIDNHIMCSESYSRFQSSSQYEELFDISAQMQEVLNRELHTYLANILNLLSNEKSSSTNIINSLEASMGFYARSVKTYNGLDLLNWQAGIMGKRESDLNQFQKSIQ
ncbi:hypothetical protein C2G38_2049983 [Gigaspora rosea]|uniref:Uncharacterized protein n=1 Tax=Gigaspora rosea TaxID=44941 RepID=A0A397TXB1_9GLOM|nr:hypothetical protein C2G38_2049983 [Gigaspora rosea]